MPLPMRKLDDRQFQDLVDEAKKRINHYCPEWTDHNVSDPGITLIELFAWMTDIILYRLNQVPDLHYVKFMEMFGVTLQPPTPAHTPVTFWLTASQATTVLIPAGTEVATTQTETKKPIVFTTDNDFEIRVPSWKTIVRYAADLEGQRRYREENLRRLKLGYFGPNEDGLVIFSPRPPQSEDALLFGFDNDLSHHILRLEFNFNTAFGAGIVPELPPYEWRASTGDNNAPWALCEVDSDTTRGMNSVGAVQLHLPKLGKQEIAGQSLYWVQVRIRELTSQDRESGIKPYDVSPRLRQIANIVAIGCTVPATHSQQVTKEVLGLSNGEPGQRFQLQATPILTRKADETLSIKLDHAIPAEEQSGDPPWVEVSDFADGDANAPYFTLDSVTGELRFGPAVQQPNGDIKLYGRVPPRGATLIFEKYRHGGGLEGNIEPKQLNTLKSAIPYVKRVENRQKAEGGMDAEALDAAMMRMPALLRSRQRAVCAEDFEFLARQAAPEVIARVKCLQPLPGDANRVVPGQVYVLVIPRVVHPQGYLTSSELEPKQADLDRVTAYLDERRLLTTRLAVRAPQYHWVAVRVNLREAPGSDREAVRNEILRRLYRFLNPLTGGTDRKGWPFGRTLYLSDIYQCLQGAPDVLFVRSASLYAANAVGELQGTAVEEIQVVAHGVIASGRHDVAFV